MTKTDWDDAYANGAYVAGAEALPERWAADASAFRSSGVRIDRDIAYGQGDRQRLDIIWPEGTAKGLAMFVHGGYWMRFDKSDWTHFANGARARGWAVAMPSYTLTPAARIADITAEIRTALHCAAERVQGPIRLAGHSAGGHLVSRLACDDVDLRCAERIEHILSISGLHDLRPLMRTAMNKALGLTLADARAESPALSEPRAGANLTAWVGGGERPEFIRQARLLEIAWAGFDVRTELVIDGTCNHFTVIDGLKDPNSAICQTFLDK